MSRERHEGGYLSGPKPESGSPPKPLLFTRAAADMLDKANDAPADR